MAHAHVHVHRTTTPSPRSPSPPPTHRLPLSLSRLSPNPIPNPRQTHYCISDPNPLLNSHPHTRGQPLNRDQMRTPLSNLDIHPRHTQPLPHTSDWFESHGSMVTFSPTLTRPSVFACPNTGSRVHISIDLDIADVHEPSLKARWYN